MDDCPHCGRSDKEKVATHAFYFIRGWLESTRKADRSLKSTRLAQEIMDAVEKEYPILFDNP